MDMGLKFKLVRHPPMNELRETKESLFLSEHEQDQFAKKAIANSEIYCSLPKTRQLN